MGVVLGGEVRASGAAKAAGIGGGRSPGKDGGGGFKVYIPFCSDPQVIPGCA